MPAPTCSHEMAGPHSPAQGWSWHVPSPPRIIVPPPALNANGIPDLHVVQDTAFDFEPSGFANAEFLQTVTYGNLISSNNMLVDPLPYFGVYPTNTLLVLGMEIRATSNGATNPTLPLPWPHGCRKRSKFPTTRRHHNGSSGTQHHVSSSEIARIESSARNGH